METVTVILDSTGRPRALAQRALVLKVVKGPDKGLTLKSAAPRVTLGTGAGADLTLTDPTISAVHCAIEADDRGLRVSDLGAKNGVRLDDRLISVAWLKEDDKIELGETLIRVTLLKETQEQPLEEANTFGRLCGSSVRMRGLYAQLSRAARSDSPVLLCGETGSGKELAAEALVQHSARRDGPLVVVDCTRLSMDLTESELFGHEKGAFTGATQTHVGAFERAHRGTLFLDEVGELPLLQQPKLLRALERAEIQRVGGQRAIPVDVRVIAATHRELEREVNQGAFRSDLYYRLAVILCRVPPLREHAEDIPELVARFLAELPHRKDLAPTTLQRLQQADYPGNVRQLKAAVERALLGLELEVAPSSGPAQPFDPAVPYRLQKERVTAQFEREYLKQMLALCGGNVSEVARRSGISRIHLHDLVHRYGLVAERTP